MAALRTVVEEPGYSTAIAQIEKRFGRVREVESALHWSLARDPGQHYRVPGTDFYIVKTADWNKPGIPVIRVLYKFDEDHVYLFEASLA